MMQHILVNARFYKLTGKAVELFALPDIGVL